MGKDAFVRAGTEYRGEPPPSRNWKNPFCQQQMALKLISQINAK
jgi:hypothetical protein